MKQKTKSLPVIEVANQRLVFNQHGALCAMQNDPTKPGYVVVTARQIDSIYAASQARARLRLPQFPDTTEEYSVQDEGNGYAQIGCQLVTPADIARVYKASQKIRKAKARK